MVSASYLHLAAKDAVMRGLVELDARISVAIWNARNHGLNSVEVVGIYEEEAFKDVRIMLLERGYNVLITYSTPIVDEEEGPTSKYYATVEIEW